MKATCKKNYYNSCENFHLCVGIEYEYKYSDGIFFVCDDVHMIKSIFYELDFYKIFYTTQELRKLKLKKLVNA